jgi:hypothetical protein
MIQALSILNHQALTLKPECTHLKQNQDDQEIKQTFLIILITS